MWISVRQGFNYQVLPVNDIKEHIESLKCECKPWTKKVNGFMIIVHNSYDMREFVEDEINEYIKKIQREV